MRREWMPCAPLLWHQVGIRALTRMPSLIIELLGDEVYAADTSSSARCLSEVSSKERCT